MGAAFLLFLCFSVPGKTAGAASAWVGSGPSNTLRTAVAAIDQEYLRAQTNLAWRHARQTLLAGHYGSSEEAYQALADQLAQAQDPELYLVSSEEFRAREDELDARHTGTGLPTFAIDRDPSTGEVRVVTAVEDSPAARAGIEPRDLIVSIDGKPTKAMTHLQVADALGVRTTGKVRLVIQRGQRQRKVTLDPTAQPLDAVQYSRRKVGGETIGYIHVLLFTPAAGERVRYAVEAMEQDGVDAYVLDLRNNPGGLFSSAEQTASVFTTGVLGSEVRESGQAERLVTHGAPVTGKPLLVLIDGGTASAAEMLAGGLRDLHRAVLVGTTTFGRGQTQQYVPLSDGYGVMVPTAELLTRDGLPFKLMGIRPDLQVGGNFMPPREIATGHDAQFRQAVALLAHS